MTPGDRPTHAPRPARALRFDGGVAETTREVPAEVPVRVVVDGAPPAVMMATPRDLEDFAWGFLLTEGLIPKAAAIAAVEVHDVDGGVEVRVALHPGFSAKQRDRAVSGRTGCGVCGLSAIEDLPLAPVRATAPVPLRLDAIRRALVALEDRQPIHAATRAVHAAAWARADGRLDEVREDVGRHNALDKLIGARARAGRAPEDGFVVLTSRCSFELVEKAAWYGARGLVTVSAPTSLALERARAHDLTLVAVARLDGVLVFHGAERILVDDPRGGRAQEGAWTSTGS